MIVFNASMIGLEMVNYGNQAWTLGKLRKPTDCRVCRVPMGVGREAWRPSTNKTNRSDRVCSPECLKLYEKEGHRF
jgi:hypothetical protein